MSVVTEKRAASKIVAASINWQAQKSTIRTIAKQIVVGTGFRLRRTDQSVPELN